MKDDQKRVASFSGRKAAFDRKFYPAGYQEFEKIFLTNCSFAMQKKTDVLKKLILDLANLYFFRPHILPKVVVVHATDCLSRKGALQVTS